MIKPEFAAFPANPEAFIIYKTKLGFDIQTAAWPVQVDIIPAFPHALFITAKTAAITY